MKGNCIAIDSDGGRRGYSSISPAYGPLISWCRICWERLLFRLSCHQALTEAEDSGALLYHLPVLRAILERLVLGKGLCVCDSQHRDETAFVSA